MRILATILLSPLAILAGTMLSFSCFGQAFTPMRPFVKAASASGGWIDPADGAGIALWFVASDLTSSPVSDWVDRVQGIHLYQATANLMPLWATNDGVKFYGTNKLYFNPAFTTTTNGSWLLLATADLVNDRRVAFDFNSTGGYFLQRNSGNTNWTTSSYAFKLADGARDEILLVISNYPINANSLYIYTNGVFHAVNSSPSLHSVGTFTNMFYTFSGTAYPFAGTVKEIIYWTNSPLTPVQVSNVHYYVTNTYGPP